MGREGEGSQEGADFKAPTSGEAKDEWGQTEGEAQAASKGRLYDTEQRIRDRMDYLNAQEDTEEEVTFEEAGHEVAIRTAIDSAGAIALEKAKEITGFKSYGDARASKPESGIIWNVEYEKAKHEALEKTIKRLKEEQESKKRANVRRRREISR